MSEGGSPRLSVSGFSSLLSISSSSSTATAAPHNQQYHHHHDGGHEALQLLPSLSLTVGGGDPMRSMSNDDGDGDDDDKSIRMMKNRESALRSRARKRAYVQELEKEVARLVDQNLNLKRQCKQLKSDMAALVQQSKSSHRRTTSTQF